MVSISVDLRKQYRGLFRTLRGIVDACPEDRWLAPHGDGYLVPCRIAYHVAACVSYHLLGGWLDRDAYYANLPYGRWLDANLPALPGKDAFRPYMEDVCSRAANELEGMTDASLAEPADSACAWAGGSRLAVHLYLMRELSDHIGELNAMLVQDGAENTVWHID